MKRDELEAVVDRLDELQQEAMDQAENERGPMDEPTERSMYYLGKDVGFARAKRAVIERVEVEEDE